MRKAIFVVCGICVVALLGGLVVAATASTDLSSPRTITVIEQTQSHFVDLGRRGPSLGDYFVFVTVFLGGGGMGYGEGPGVRKPRDPDEYVRIRGDQLQPKDGRSELRVT